MWGGGARRKADIRREMGGGQLDQQTVGRAGMKNTEEQISLEDHLSCGKPSDLPLTWLLPCLASQGSIVRSDSATQSRCRPEAWGSPGSSLWPYPGPSESEWVHEQDLKWCFSQPEKNWLKAGVMKLGIKIQQTCSNPALPWPQGTCPWASFLKPQFFPL